MCPVGTVLAPLPVATNETPKETELEKCVGAAERESGANGIKDVGVNVPGSGLNSHDIGDKVINPIT